MKKGKHPKRVVERQFSSETYDLESYIVIEVEEETFLPQKISLKRLLNSILLLCLIVLIVVVGALFVLIIMPLIYIVLQLPRMRE